MRWGVRDEATDDHMTTTICLEEIRNCQQASIGPNFIFFGGQKYGYRPIPNVVECEEFDKIQRTIQDMDKDDTLLCEWSVLGMFSRMTGANFVFVPSQLGTRGTRTASRRS